VVSVAGVSNAELSNANRSTIVQRNPLPTPLPRFVSSSDAVHLAHYRSSGSLVLVPVTPIGLAAGYPLRQQAVVAYRVQNASWVRNTFAIRQNRRGRCVHTQQGGCACMLTFDELHWGRADEKCKEMMMYTCVAGAAGRHVASHGRAGVGAICHPARHAVCAALCVVGPHPAPRAVPGSNHARARRARAGRAGARHCAARQCDTAAAAGEPVQY
jgi:hypothetical protein